MDLAAGVLLCLLAVFVLVIDDTLHTAAAVFAVAGVVLLAASVPALRFVRGRDRRAKVAACVAGVLTLVAGLPFLPNILGFALVVIGLAIGVLALLPDGPEPQT